MSGDQLPVNCGNCIFCVELPNTNGQGGECHFDPPAVIVIYSQVLTAGGKNQHINTVFPPVPVNSWCGKFHPRIPPTPSNEAGNQQE